MIPLRIQLKGFLCYRDEQEVLLDGSSLWLLAGVNGSGKSAVFDAMTFALFGHHRGGGQQVVELINHDSDRLNVEFDFSLDGQVYRVRRTAVRSKDNKARTTQQVLRRQPPVADGEPPRWEPIESTGRHKEFNDWVRDHIGLTYDTFTSSVLLLQGRAEKLLDSTASGRFEVLAGIVDLDRFRRLYERADGRRKELKAEVEVLEHQIEGMEEVSDAELAAIDEHIREATELIEQGKADEARLVELEAQARRWGELLLKRSALDERWRQAQSTLAEADAIRKDLDRLNELREVLPILTAALEKKTLVRTAAGRLEKLAADEKVLADREAACIHQVELSRRNLERLQKQRDEDEARHRDVQRQLRDLSGLVEKVKMCETQRGTLTRLQGDLDALPPDLESRLARLREEGQRLTDLERALPLLSRVVQQRRELRQVRESESTLTRQEKDRLKSGEALKQRHEQLKQALEAASRERQAADGKAVEEKTKHDQARTSLRDFKGLQGSRVCRHCGQPLTAGHYEEEKKKREKEVEETKAHSQHAEQVAGKVRAEEERCRRELAGCDSDLENARDEYRTWKRDLEQARRDAERLQRELVQAVADLPEFYRARAGGAGVDGEPAFPSESDIASLRQQASGLDALRKEQRETEHLLTRCQSLRAQAEQARQTLLALEADLPGDVGALRRKHASMTSQDTVLAESIKATRKAERAESETLEKLNVERAELHRKRTDVAGQLKTEEAQRKINLDEIERLRRTLPAAWQKELDSAAMAEIHRYSGERDDLVRADVEGRARQLEQARISLESLRQARTDVEAECESFPAEARVEPTEVHSRLRDARVALSTHEAALHKAQHRRAVLDSRRQQREQLQRQQLEKEGELNRYTVLSKLLGRERLQRHLVRQAERQVVDHANAVLDRLSGGQLYLRLCGSDDDGDDRALELEAYNRSTASSPINVAFLSGSQRFRVAVSLALGLGQYASRQHRPIESVIIDEGFGCLDRQGRQVMIQELQNLRGQLRCILLVSHQEEFADAFSDGYLFELENGATRVKRFQR